MRCGLSQGPEIPTRAAGGVQEARTRQWFTLMPSQPARHTGARWICSMMGLDLEQDSSSILIAFVEKSLRKSVLCFSKEEKGPVGCEASRERLRASLQLNHLFPSSLNPLWQGEGTTLRPARFLKDPISKAVASLALLAPPPLRNPWSQRLHVGAISMLVLGFVTRCVLVQKRPPLMLCLAS